MRQLRPYLIKKQRYQNGTKGNELGLKREKFNITRLKSITFALVMEIDLSFKVNHFN